MQRYRSGHNGADSKSVCWKQHEGSNPSLCAKRPQFSRIAVLILHYKQFDKLANYADTEKAVKRFANCTFISFENGGHLMEGHEKEI